MQFTIWNEQNIESGGEILGDYYVSLSDEEENDMQYCEQEKIDNINFHKQLIFAANKEKIDIFFEFLRVPYVQKLLGPSSGY